MKNLLLSISLSLCFMASQGQVAWNIDFENPNYIDRVRIDTSSNPHNTWQVGIPSKIIFNSAHSPTHAIVTDTLNPYPVNDTSSFIITHVRSLPEGGNTVLLLDFYFQLNTDTLSDHGIIEASIDHGITWINLMTEDSTYQLWWFEPKPVLSGNTIGWTHFSLNLAALTYVFGYSDTLLYRFTFVSDGIQTNKEGWMIDDFSFADFWEGIQKIQNNDLISIFPNPTSEELSIQITKPVDRQIVQILNITGQQVYFNPNFTEKTINTHELANGIYLLKYYNSNYFSIKRFVVNHQ